MTFTELTILSYTGLALIVLIGIVAYKLAITPQYVQNCALLYLMDRYQRPDPDNQLVLQVTNNMIINLTSGQLLSNRKLYIRPHNKVWFVKEAYDRRLSAKQQLVLFNRLVGVDNKLHQARKIIKPRTVREVVDIAHNCMLVGEHNKTALLHLFY